MPGGVQAAMERRHSHGNRFAKIATVKQRKENMGDKITRGMHAHENTQNGANIVKGNS